MFVGFVCVVVVVVTAAWRPRHGGVAWWSSLCCAGGGCVMVLECGCRVVVVVVEPIIGCHIVESDDMAPGSVVNNKVRVGNGDLLRIETMNDNIVVIRCLPRCCQRRGTLDSVVYSWLVVVHWVTWRCHVIRVVVVMGDGCGWWPMVMVAMRRRW